jgi:hypothetical protein
MADTYTWGIANLERHVSDGAVYTAHWTLNAERVTGGEIYNASSYGSVGFPDPDPDNFTPYEDLTSSQVIGWVQDTLTAEKVVEMEAALSSSLDSEVTPTNESGIPW